MDMRSLNTIPTIGQLDKDGVIKVPHSLYLTITHFCYAQHLRRRPRLNHPGF